MIPQPQLEARQRRISLWAGKFDVCCFFSVNSVSQRLHIDKAAHRSQLCSLVRLAADKWISSQRDSCCHATSWQSQDVLTCQDRGAPADKAGFQEASCSSQRPILLLPCSSMQKETSAFGDLLLMLYLGEFRWILQPQLSTRCLMAGLLPVQAHSHHLHDSGLWETE